ncbi:TonB-dependent receptor [Alishewanella tabrizica]|uniref:TonB-dependent receptor n=2 Tax=Alishewanella tabrizica TaxID=671278 RepID=A0ABQ2WEJ4_9ALTE|nr:TonB-dependent receptor [Alishewanella tabrizica]
MFAVTRPTALSLAIAVGLSPLTTFASSTDDTADIEHISVNYKQAYRGDVPLRLQAQAVESIHLEMIRDNGITRFQDALDLAGSIARQNNGGGLWDSFSIRGFPGNENMPSGYLVNGFNAGRGFSGNRDLVNVEYIEILKGPGSALFGRSEPGGTVNIITKKPQHQTEGYVQVSAGSYDQYRVEGDYTTGLTDQVAVRLNGAVQEFGSFRDFVFTDKTVFTPSVRYALNDNTALLYEFEYLKQSQLFDRGYLVLNNDLKTLPRSRYLGEPADGATEIDATGHQLTLESTLASGWSFLTGLSYRESSLEGNSSDAELARARQSLFNDGTTLTRQRRNRDYRAEDLSIRAELSGNINLFGKTHHILMGADGYDYSLYTLLGRFRGPAGSYSLDIFNPIYGATAPDPRPLYINDEAQWGLGVFIQDQIKLTERWHLSLGVRLDRYRLQIAELLANSFSKQVDSKVSPRIGVVYELSDALTFYSSYTEGFIPLSGTDFNRNPFAPEESQSFEFGAKYSAGSTQGTLSFFDAEKSNILTSDPVNVGFQATLGRAQSRGIEFELHRHLTDNLYLDLSYAMMDTKTVGEVINADWGSLVPSGSRLVNVPRHQGTAILTTETTLASKASKFGIKARYIGSRLGDSVDPSYQLKAVTLFSAFMHIDLSTQLQAQLNIDNIFDTHYVHNSYNRLWTVPGEPVSVRAAIRYQF